VEHVREGERAKELLGVVRAPGVAGPQTKAIARAPPRASLGCGAGTRCPQGPPRWRATALSLLIVRRRICDCDACF
jgi:hypothetical protein